MTPQNKNDYPSRTEDAEPCLAHLMLVFFAVQAVWTGIIFWDLDKILTLLKK
jgi:hypothetical protein